MNSSGLPEAVETYAPLLALSRQEESGPVETAALALVLHSFYNGVENILRTVARQVDRDPPQGTMWHRDLLERRKSGTESRPAVIEPSTVERLLEYLGFRHVVRHFYTTHLDVERMRHLAVGIDNVWARVKGDVERFLARMQVDS